MHTFECSDCGAKREKEKNRLPPRWKRLGGGILCGHCWPKKYALRAITLPVVKPIDRTWEEFRVDLRAAWVEVTQASNWIVTELYARDARRNGQEKIPPMEKVYLYPEIRNKFPNLEPQTVSSLEKSVKAKYLKQRYDLIWRNKVSLPNHRYPTPLPIPAKAWSVEIEKERPAISLRVGGSRIKLQLKGGSRYRRQRVAIEKMASGLAGRGEASLYQRLIDEKPTLLCKMAAYLPRNKSNRRAGTLIVRTDADAMIVALNAKDEKLWVFHGDHLPRWTMEHAEQLQRWADDSKYEQRPVVSFSQRRKRAAQKYRDRMNSACHELAAHVAGYADRRWFETVEFNSEERGFCKKFPWYQLTELMKEKCEFRGIEFIASGPVEEEIEDALENGESHDG